MHPKLEKFKLDKVIHRGQIALAVKGPLAGKNVCIKDFHNQFSVLVESDATLVKEQSYPIHYLKLLRQKVNRSYLKDGRPGAAILVKSNKNPASTLVQFDMKHAEGIDLSNNGIVAKEIEKQFLRRQAIIRKRIMKKTNQSTNSTKKKKPKIKNNRL